MKGSGEAYHSWNSDQLTATAMMALAATPPGLRPPMSASATSCSRSDLLAAAAGPFAVITVLSGEPSSGLPALGSNVQRAPKELAERWMVGTLGTSPSASKP